MKIVLIQVGKTREHWLAEGIAEYAERLEKYVSFETVTINVPNSKRAGNAGYRRAQESARVGEVLKPGDLLALLDEKGKPFSSSGFADYLRRKQNAGTRRLVFVIGGAHGFDESLKKNAAELISL